MLNEFPLGQQQMQPGVVDHITAAIQRIIRVKRYIGAPRFHHRQYRHHQPRRTFQADADRDFRPHALRRQQVSQLIGALIEFLIGQRLRAEFQRDKRRRPLRLLFDQLVPAEPIVKRSGGLIPAQQLLMVGVGQQRQRPQRAFRLLQK